MGFRQWLMGLLRGGDGPAAGDIDPLQEEAAGLNFRTAIEAHQKWKYRLRAVIDGTSEETLQPEMVARDDQCVLGKWIHGPGGQQFGHDHQFKGLKEWHAHFHVCAGHVLSLAQAGETEAALKDLNKGHYAKASMKVVQDLAQMYNRLKP